MDAEVASNRSPTAITNSQIEGEATALMDRRHNQPAEIEAAEGEGTSLTAEGYFSLRHCDSDSLSSFSLETPSLPRKLHAQEDTDSLVSTGTLVPEAIYLPPAGHRLVTHSDWDSLNAQVQTTIYLVRSGFVLLLNHCVFILLNFKKCCHSKMLRVQQKKKASFFYLLPQSFCSDQKLPRRQKTLWCNDGVVCWAGVRAARGGKSAAG